MLVWLWQPSHWRVSLLVTCATDTCVLPTINSHVKFLTPNGMASGGLLAFCYCVKIPENQLKRRKGSFGGTDLVLLVHDTLAFCFGACGCPVHRGRSTWRRRLLGAKDRERGRGQGPTIPSRARPQWPNFLSLDPPSKGSCTSHSTRLGTNPSAHGRLQDILDPKCSRRWLGLDEVTRMDLPWWSYQTGKDTRSFLHTPGKVTWGHKQGRGPHWQTTLYPDLRFQPPE
jgi:hypothetical protein